MYKLTHADILAHIRTYICTYADTNTPIHAHQYTYTSTHVLTHTDKQVHMKTPTQIHTYMQFHSHENWQRQVEMRHCLSLNSSLGVHRLIASHCGRVCTLHIAMHEYCMHIADTFERQCTSIACTLQTRLNGNARVLHARTFHTFYT